MEEAAAVGQGEEVFVDVESFEEDHSEVEEESVLPRCKLQLNADAADAPVVDLEAGP